jgi:hypothetical protein
MSDQKRVAAVAETVRDISDRFESYGIPDPHDAAERLVRWMQARGWRVHVELADKAPPSPRRAPAEVQAQYMAEIRAGRGKGGER